MRWRSALLSALIERDSDHAVVIYVAVVLARVSSLGLALYFLKP
jgi:hypothetical protein